MNFFLKLRVFYFFLIIFASPINVNAAIIDLENSYNELIEVRDWNNDRVVIGNDVVTKMSFKLYFFRARTNKTFDNFTIIFNPWEPNRMSSVKNFKLEVLEAGGNKMKFDASNNCSNLDKNSFCYTEILQHYNIPPMMYEIMVKPNSSNSYEFFFKINYTLSDGVNRKGFKQYVFFENYCRPNCQIRINERILFSPQIVIDSTPTSSAINIFPDNTTSVSREMITTDGTQRYQIWFSNLNEIRDYEERKAAFWTFVGLVGGLFVSLVIEKLKGKEKAYKLYAFGKKKSKK